MRRRFFPLQSKNSIGYPSTDLSHESPNNSAYAIPINSKPLPNSCRSNMQSSSIKALSSSPPKRSFHIKDPETIDPKATLANSIPIQSPASALPASFQAKQQLRHQMNYHFNDKSKIISSSNVDSHDGLEQNDSLLDDRQSSSKEQPQQLLSTTNKTKKVITFPVRDISPRLRFMQIPLDKISEQKPQGTQLPLSQKNQNKLITFESKQLQEQHDSKQQQHQQQQQQKQQPQSRLISGMQNPYASKQTKKLVSSGGQRVRKLELERNSINSINHCSYTLNKQSERDQQLFSSSYEQQQLKGVEDLQSKLNEICAFQRKCPSLKEKSKIRSRECSIVTKEDNESKTQPIKNQFQLPHEDSLLNPKSQCLNEKQKSNKFILNPRKSQSTMRQQSILRERENKEKKIISDFSIYRVNSPQSSQNRFQTPQTRLVINVDITTQPAVPIQIESFSRQESSREEHEQTINVAKNNNCFRGDNQMIIPTSNTSNARKYLPQLIFRRQSKGDISSNSTKQEQISKAQSPQNKLDNQNKQEEGKQVPKEKRFVQVVNHSKPAAAQRFPPPPILISDLVDDFPGANSPIQGQRTPSQDRRVLRKKEMNNQQTIKGLTPQAQGQFKQLFRRFNALKQNSKEKNRISNMSKCPISEISTNTELSMNNNNQMPQHNQELMFIPERSLTPDNNNMIQSLLEDEESQEKRLNSQVSEEQQFEFLQLSFLNSFAWPQENSAIFEIKKDKWNQQENLLDENARNNVLRAGLDKWESPKKQKKKEIFGDQIGKLCDRRDDIAENDKESVVIMHKDDGGNRSNIAINFSIDQSSMSSSSKSAERLNHIFQEKPSSRLENLVEEPSSPELRNKNCLQMIVRQCKN